jgi:hypothetical protein
MPGSPPAAVVSVKLNVDYSLLSQCCLSSSTGAYVAPSRLSFPSLWRALSSVRIANTPVELSLALQAYGVADRNNLEFQQALQKKKQNFGAPGYVVSPESRRFHWGEFHG